MTLDRGEAPVPRRWAYAAWGLLLSVGAPAGLLLVRIAAGRAEPGALAREWATDGLTYVYVAASTALVFAWFGAALGRRADALASLATFDGLTGLLNRRALGERLEAEVHRSHRHQQPLAVLAIDLDGLKAINDGSGHEAGDAALRTVSEALRSMCRTSDIIGRWGGDEFLVVAPGDSDSPAAARRLAERIREEVARRESAVPLSVSIGMATRDASESSAQPVLRRADAALYEAKRAGRDRVVGE